MSNYEHRDKRKNCPWCGWTPELVDARELAGSEDEIKDFDEEYPFFMRCDNAMCNVQPITKGASTEEHAVCQWDNMQSATSIGL